MLTEAIAEDGPLAGDPNLTVETGDDQWPHFAIWEDGGRKHEYRLRHPPEEHSLSASGAIPIYVFVRTIEPGE